MPARYAGRRPRGHRPNRLLALPTTGARQKGDRPRSHLRRRHRTRRTAEPTAAARATLSQRRLVRPTARSHACPRAEAADLRHQQIHRQRVRRSPTVRSAARFVRPTRSHCRRTLVNRRNVETTRSCNPKAARSSAWLIVIAGALALPAASASSPGRSSSKIMLYWNLAPRPWRSAAKAHSSWAWCSWHRDFGDTAATRPEAARRPRTPGPTATNGRRPDHDASGGSAPFYADLVRAQAPMRCSRILKANSTSWRRDWARRLNLRCELQSPCILPFGGDYDVSIG